MIIACPKCSTGFFVTPKQIGPTGRRVKCSKCNHIWHAKIITKYDNKYSDAQVIRYSYDETKPESKKTTKEDNVNNKSSAVAFSSSKLDQQNKSSDSSSINQGKIFDNSMENIFSTDYMLQNDNSKNIVENINLQSNIIENSQNNFNEEENFDNSEISEPRSKISELLKKQEEIDIEIGKNIPQSDEDYDKKEKKEESVIVRRINDAPPENIINLPAILPIKIPYHLAILPVMLMILIISIIWFFYPIFSNNILFGRSLYEHEDVKITGYTYKYDKNLNILDVKYEITNNSEKSKFLPLVLINLHYDNVNNITTYQEDLQNILLSPKDTHRSSVKINAKSSDLEYVDISLVRSKI